MNRRDLIGGTAAVAAAGSALAGVLGIAAQACPDAALIAAIRAHPRLADAFENEAQDDGPAFEAWSPCNALICRTDPVTVAGVVAKARLAVAQLDQWNEGGQFFHSDAEKWAFSVLTSLVRLADVGLIEGAA